MKGYALLIGAAAVLVILSGTAGDAQAQGWTVCNRTPNPLRVGIGYAGPNGGIVTEGWWSIGSCGGCEFVLNADETADRGTVYLHAHTRDGSDVVSGSEDFCVGRSPFTIHGAQRSCGRTESFQARTVNLNKDWTTNINGSGCID
jgi:uncharacterized membrane protein